MGAGAISVEEVVEEAAPPLVVVVTVVAAVLAVVTVVAVLRLGIARCGRRIPGCAVWRRWWGRRRWRRHGPARGCRVPGVPVRLGVEESLELTAVEEDPAAFGALIHGDAATFVRSHLTMTLGAGHLHLTHGTRPGHPGKPPLPCAR